jgi:hypothetical protein
MGRAGEFIEGVAPQARQVAQDPLAAILVAGVIGFALGYLVRGR